MSDQKKTQSNNTHGSNSGSPGHGQKDQGSHGHGGGKVIPLNGGCLADGCKAKAAKASFCMEHFDWFKEGLITKEGRKPSDFDKKFYAYQNRKSHKKAA